MADLDQTSGTLDDPAQLIGLEPRSYSNRASDGQGGHGTRALVERTPFRSILGAGGSEQVEADGRQEPACFHDLNLDQIVEAVTAGRARYDLKPFFHRTLRTVDQVLFRQEVMRDLEAAALADGLRAFAATMDRVRAGLERSSKMYYRYQKERVFLAAMQAYCAAVAELRRCLVESEPSSRGLTAFHDALDCYASSKSFTEMRDAAGAIAADLGTIRYDLLIEGGRVRVQRPESDVDFGAEVEALFSKFQQRDDKGKRGANADDRFELDHVEAKILDRVALLHPEVFGRLSGFFATYQGGVDPLISRFDREMQFYVSFLDHMAAFTGHGLGFCQPVVSATSKAVSCTDAFDLALATKLLRSGGPVVCNDVELSGDERIVVVSGPNQGGKTTFARTFGQLHHLAGLGLPVPGREAHLFLCDAIHTHFEREESVSNLRGKLQDDLVRIHEILDRATPDSLIVMNEIFSSTTLQDASFLAERVVEKVADLDALCVVVTFMDELSRLNAKTVSAVSTVVPDDPAQRTFKVVRRPADGRAYALSLAEKYRLTYAALSARLRF